MKFVTIYRNRGENKIKKQRRMKKEGSKYRESFKTVSHFQEKTLVQGIACMAWIPWSTYLLISCTAKLLFQLNLILVMAFNWVGKKRRVLDLLILPFWVKRFCYGHPSFKCSFHRLPCLYLSCSNSVFHLLFFW